MIYISRLRGVFATKSWLNDLCQLCVGGPVQWVSGKSLGLMENLLRSLSIHGPLMGCLTHVLLCLSVYLMSMNTLTPLHPPHPTVCPCSLIVFLYYLTSMHLCQMNIHAVK